MAILSVTGCIELERVKRQEDCAQHALIGRLIEKIDIYCLGNAAHNFSQDNVRIIPVRWKGKRSFIIIFQYVHTIRTYVKMEAVLLCCCRAYFLELE